MATKREQFDRTRRALLDAGREMFTEQGYAATSTEGIVRRAGVTRGALYHHFRDKAALFEAVYEEVRLSWAQGMRDRMEAAEGDTWHRIVHTGCTAFIDAIADPSTRRIIYIDGPAVMESAKTRTHTPGQAIMQQSLGLLMAEGLIEDRPLESLSRLFWGAFYEAAIYIANADDTEKARNEIARDLEYLLNGIRIKP